VCGAEMDCNLQRVDSVTPKNIWTLKSGIMRWKICIDGFGGDT
jgi:hypothetical protein